MHPSDKWALEKNKSFRGYRGPILKPNGEWVKASDIIKEHYGRDCPRCGDCMPKGRASIDHFLAKSKYPERMFDYSNLEVICISCNSAKRTDELYFAQQAMIRIENRRPKRRRRRKKTA